MNYLIMPIFLHIFNGIVSTKLFGQSGLEGVVMGVISIPILTMEKVNK